MINDKTVVAIIPARKGSQGIPGKNYRDICGRPLIEWSILSALHSDFVDKVIVSTNCLICETIARECDPNIQIVARPDSLATASSKTEDAMLHAFEQATNDYDIVCLLQPTSPVRDKDLIDKALRLKEATQSKSLLTVSAHTPFFFRLQNGISNCMFDIYNRKMRQEMSESDLLYHDDGCLYLTDADVLISTKCRLDNNPYLLVNDTFSSFQIDSEIDFVILSKIMDELQKSDKYIMGIC